MTTMNKRTNDY